jgi:hypothetical protein
MTNGLPDNVYIQVQLSTPDHDHQPVTRLISKQDMIDSLFDWVNLFIEYKDYDIEDVVFNPNRSLGGGGKNTPRPLFSS